MMRKNWINEQTEMFIGLVYDQKLKAKGKIDWSKIRDQFRSMAEIDKIDRQLKKNYDQLNRKLKAFDDLMSMTGAGFDHHTGLPILPNDSWERFEKNHPGFASLRKQPLVAIDKLRFLFSWKQATGKMSFAPGMKSQSASEINNFSNLDINSGEGSGDSDDICEDLNDDDTAGDESRSPPKSIETSTSKKRKSEVENGGTMSLKRQKAQDPSVRFALSFVQSQMEKENNKKKEPTIYEQVGAKLDEMEEVKKQGNYFIFQAMEVIRERNDMEYFMGMPNDEVRMLYLQKKME